MLKNDANLLLKDFFLKNIYVEKQNNYIEKLLAPNYMQRLYSAFTEILSKHHISYHDEVDYLYKTVLIYLIKYVLW